MLKKYQRGWNPGPKIRFCFDSNVYTVPIPANGKRLIILLRHQAICLKCRQYATQQALLIVLKRITGILIVRLLFFKLLHFIFDR